MIVAGIIEKATRMKLEDFAMKYLFGPMGITEYYWLKDSTGFCHAGGGLYLKPMDMLTCKLFRKTGLTKPHSPTF
jgi:hypothetical protein